MLNFEPVAYENNINIEYSIEPDIIINADKTMLTQLAHILLDNALKYAGDNGHVSIKLSRASDGCSLSINNSGEVIASDDLAHLFDRFYRADKSRAKGGYGLGLSIAYNIVREMKGKIEVASTLEQGTTFTVNLPR